MKKGPGRVLCFSMAAFAVVALAFSASVFPCTALAAPGNPDHGAQAQDITRLKLSPQQATLIEAIRIASNPNVGYSFEHANLNPDVICYTFVNHVMIDSNIKGISEEFAAALAKETPDTATGLVGMKTQSRALETIGYVRHDFVGFDDPYLTEGSVLYNCFDNGGFSHVEFYLGRFDLDQLDENGNPRKNADGTPMTIGARIDNNDATMGDQQQIKEKCWLGGEVGAFEGDSRGDKYWDCYYAPENLKLD